MTEFEKNIKRLIKRYAQFDRVTGALQKCVELTPAVLQEMEGQLLPMISDYLLQDGLELASVEKNYTALNAYLVNLIKDPSAYKWLDSVISLNGCPGGLLHLSAYCKEKTVEFISRQQIKSEPKPVMPYWPEMTDNKLADAQTWTERTILTGIQEMNKQAELYHQNLDSMGSTVLKPVVQSLPYISSGLCVVFFIEELAVLSACSFLMSKGGGWLSRSDDERLEMLGKTINGFNASLLNAATGLFSGMVAMNYYMLNKMGSMGSDVSHRLYSLLTGDAPASSSESYLDACSSLSGQPTLLATDLLEGVRFKWLPLKLMSLPFEDYCHIQSQQRFGWFRFTGKKKNLLYQDIVKAFLLIDQGAGSNKEKLAEAQDVVNALKINPMITREGCNAADALAEAEAVCARLTNNGDLAYLVDDDGWTLDGQKPVVESSEHMGSKVDHIDKYVGMLLG